MTILQITYAPHPIFKQKAQLVVTVNDAIRKIANDMLETMYFEKAVGIGANMVGVTQQIIVLDLQEKGTKQPYIMINPEIIELSQNVAEGEESSISFPGISTVINRPNKIKVQYRDLDNNQKTLEAEGFLARVIQHELDYLHGKIFLDYLSKLKRDMLTKKMVKYIKTHPPHIHGNSCHH